MKKVIEIPIVDFYYNRLSRPVRERKDCVLLLLDTLNMLDSSVPTGHENAKGKLIIKTDKMSRVFYFMENKYFSIFFPFSIEEKAEGVNAYSIYDVAQDREIDNRAISLLRIILDKVDFINSTVENMLESIYYDMAQEGYDSQDIECCWNILMRLFSTEFGYLRYDYDIEHANGDLHPLYHLDINYSSKCTYRLGLREKFLPEDFTDLVDVQTKCKYVV